MGCNITKHHDSRQTYISFGFFDIIYHSTDPSSICNQLSKLFKSGSFSYEKVEGAYIFSLSMVMVTLFVPPGWGGGGYLTKFYTGRLRPEVQPLTLSYTILAEKVPLLYTFYWKKVPLSHTYFRKSCSSFHVVLNK